MIYLITDDNVFTNKFLLITILKLPLNIYFNDYNDIIIVAYKITSYKIWYTVTNFTRYLQRQQFHRYARTLPSRRSRIRSAAP